MSDIKLDIDIDGNLGLKVNSYTDSFIVTEVFEGKGRLTGLLEKINIRNNDNDLKCCVGIGFSKEERLEFLKTDIIGKIVEIKYTGIITVGNSKIKTLSLPYFIKVI